MTASLPTSAMVTGEKFDLAREGEEERREEQEEKEKKEKKKRKKKEKKENESGLEIYFFIWACVVISYWDFDWGFLLNPIFSLYLSFAIFIGFPCFFMD